MPSRKIRRAVAAAVGIAVGASVTGLWFMNGAQAVNAAAQAGIDGFQVRYTAAVGQTNQVNITVTEQDADDGINSTAYRVLIDDRVTIEPGDGCTYPDDADHTTVACVVPVDDYNEDDYSYLKVVLKDKNDSVTYDSADDSADPTPEFWLGSGNDTYTYVDAKRDGARIWGQNGRDMITATQLDRVRGGNGADTIIAHGNGLQVHGGNGNDVIAVNGTSQARNYLYGDKGSDVIHANGGPDTVNGGPGDDRLFGRAGKDTIIGAAGDDYLNGGKGNDKLLGGKGDDRLKGGPGNDTVKGGPGKDTIVS